MEIIVVEKDKVMQLIVAKKTALYANSSIFVCFPLIIDRRLRQNGKRSIMFETCLREILFPLPFRTPATKARLSYMPYFSALFTQSGLISIPANSTPGKGNTDSENKEKFKFSLFLRYTLNVVRVIKYSP